MIGKLIRWTRCYIHFEDTPKAHTVSPPGSHGVPALTLNLPNGSLPMRQRPYEMTPRSDSMNADRTSFHKSNLSALSQLPERTLIVPLNAQLGVRRATYGR